MNETLFFVIGLSLVALALIISFVGLRMEKFPPSRGALIAGIGVFAAVVLATMTFAWLHAEDEQEHRDEEIAAGELVTPQQGLKEQQEAVEQPTAEQPPGEGEAAQKKAEATGKPAAADGAQIFADQGCGGCHTLAAANATGTVGPDLDAALKGKDEQFIETSIVDPNAEVAKGYQPDVMPQNFGDALSPEQLQALVQYLSQSASGSS